MALSFASCKDDNTNGEEKHYITVTEYSLKEGTVLSDMASGIGNQYKVSMPMDVSDKTLESLFHISPSAAEEYAGIFSISMSSADNILIVKPYKGKETVIKHGFEQRKQDVLDTFTGYLQASYDQAEKAFVLERDGYYIFLCLNGEEAEITEYIETTYFDKTEKQVEVSADEVPEGNEDQTIQDDSQSVTDETGSTDTDIADDAAQAE